jgi:hypothetical protein
MQLPCIVSEALARNIIHGHAYFTVSVVLHRIQQIVQLSFTSSKG